ncbi:hypothetical protein BJ322DRAFT_1017988 [Thelephora terrestris]|uniref:Uncharacterized protein n=1 Tax=Thelephora terrestris TaxID=56493 RepID=A0A9P6LA09_9AGAM|nr:hypothetical protein BJ322DRAFT_1017988 [Thelephora terrestris]
MAGLPFTIHLHPTCNSPFQWMPPCLEERYLEQARLQGRHQVCMPRVRTLILEHCRERLDTLNAAAEAAIKENVEDADPEYAMMINTFTQLELSYYLSDQYLRAYKALINAIGMQFFDVAGDRLNKKDDRKATEEESEADIDKSERRLPLSSTKPTSTMQYYPIRPAPFQWLPGTLAEEFRSRNKLHEELHLQGFHAESPGHYLGPVRGPPQEALRSSGN